MESAPDKNGEDKKPLGFARLSPEERKEVSRRGGQNAQARGTAHRWDTQTARAAVMKREENRKTKEYIEGRQ